MHQQQRPPAVVASLRNMQRLRDYQAKPEYKHKEKKAIKKAVISAFLFLAFAITSALLSIMALPPNATNHPL